MKKVNKLLTYVIMLDFLVVAYVELVMMLIDLLKVLSQELKCLYGNTVTVLSK